MARLYRVLVPVTDIEKAQAFYSAVLGQPGQRVSPGRHYFDCEGTILACFDPEADHDRRSAKPNPEEIYIAVDDLEATYAACKTAGATFTMGEIATRPWGETSFYIQDPFRNPICFVAADTLFTG